MSEGLRTILGAAPWAPLAIAFLVGFACGWLIWGLRNVDGADAEGAAAGPSAVEADDRKEIVVLRAELEAARALLDEGEGQQDDVARQLSSLDEALKRANGRLKILLRSVKR
jgi:hypothetical protein